MLLNLCKLRLMHAKEGQSCGANFESVLDLNRNCRTAHRQRKSWKTVDPLKMEVRNMVTACLPYYALNSLIIELQT